jgi:hypothetical protein
MRPVHQLLLAFATLGVVPAAAAQQPASPPAQENGQSVTVTGERPDDEAERRREASRFFESPAVRTRIGQLARWHEPICVRTGGLPLETNARISVRVMEIAESLGIPTNRAERCPPNVRIAFTSEPQRLVERAERRNRLVIGFHYAARREQVMQVRQPVQAWYVTTTRNGLEERVDEAGGRAPGGAAGSRLTNGISSGLAHVLIVADLRHAEGEDADSIAELLAYLALAQTPVAETCDAADTILNRMNPACPAARRPVALTAYDTAYLRALYSVDPTWGPRLQRGSVVLDMADRLGGGP